MYIVPTCGGAPSSTWPPTFLALPITRSSFMSALLLRFRISIAGTGAGFLVRAASSWEHSIKIHWAVGTAPAAVILLGAGAIAWPLAGRAQQPNDLGSSGPKEYPHRPQLRGGQAGDARPRWRGGAVHRCPASPPPCGVLPLPGSWNWHRRETDRPGSSNRGERPPRP